jgi:GNAT superfamily N-acetyltransferase
MSMIWQKDYGVVTILSRRPSSSEADSESIQINELWTSLLHEINENKRQGHLCEDIEDEHHQIHSEKANVLIAIHDARSNIKTLQGFLYGVNDSNERCIHVDLICAQKGYGSKLIGCLKEFAYEHKTRSIKLVSIDNAIFFYRKMGFENSKGAKEKTSITRWVQRLESRDRNLVDISTLRHDQGFERFLAMLKTDGLISVYDVIDEYGDLNRIVEGYYMVYRMENYNGYINNNNNNNNNNVSSIINPPFLLSYSTSIHEKMHMDESFDEVELQYQPSNTHTRHHLKQDSYQYNNDISSYSSDRRPKSFKRNASIHIEDALTAKVRQYSKSSRLQPL